MARATEGAVPRNAAGRTLLFLFLLGLAIEGCLLWWVRISIDGSSVHPVTQTAITGLFEPFERMFGPILHDGPGTRERVKIANFMWGFVPAFLFYLLACGLAFCSRLRDHPRLLPLILGFSILFRLTLVPSAPILETDIYRYLWDGAVGASHVNPYKYAPVEVSRAGEPGREELYSPAEHAELRLLSRLRAEPELGRHFEWINHPKVPTIYPPLAQVAFSLAYRLAPGGIGTLKSLVVLADIAILGLVVVILRLLGKGSHQVIVYGWCPLALKEYASSGHYDPFATLLVLAAIILLLRRRPLWASLAFGMGALVKIYPLAVALVLTRRIGIVGLLVVALTLSLGYAPYLSIGRHVFDGLFAFTSDWEFNSSLFSVVDLSLSRVVTVPYVLRLAVAPQRGDGFGFTLDDFLIDSFLLAKVVLGIVGLLFLAVLTLWRDEGDGSLVGRVFAAVGSVVFLGPVANPWYFCWLLPFAALFPGFSWIYLSGTMAVHYLYFWSHQYVPWSRVVEYVPFYVLLILEHRACVGVCARQSRRFIDRIVRWLRSERLA